LKREGKSRHELGREAFLQEVWKWKESSGNRIYSQIRRLGASVDWSRESFTMDAARSAAVEEAFLRLHDRGLIRRANRIVNWSCALRSAISNIEVDQRELDGPTLLRVPQHEKPVEFGVIHSFAYPLADGSGELVVATTRMETMLGDTAVAVHPDDVRYKHLHGKLLRHPFIPARVLRVIADGELVDMAFGTGAVKVTPAHDPNDFKCGERNGLECINIFHDDGRINHNGGDFDGCKRFEARETIIQQLTAMGLYRGKASNKMTLGVCSRSKDIIEPVVRPQWWVMCEVRQEERPNTDR
jgi:valyl-tRNA synthetase